MQSWQREGAAVDNYGHAKKVLSMWGFQSRDESGLEMPKEVLRQKALWRLAWREMMDAHTRGSHLERMH